MQRETWTDGRLDELSRRMDAGFERVDRDLRELRALIYRFGTGIIVAIVLAAISRGI